MSEIKTNKLTGVSTAKTVTVTVGATATQSLEQGLGKAWARWDNSDNDGSGTTTPGDSFSVSSIGDDNTGSNIINLTNAMTNTNYAVVALAQYVDTNGLTIAEGPSGVTTSSYRIRTRTGTNSVYDSDFVSTVLFGDTA